MNGYEVCVMAQSSTRRAERKVPNLACGSRSGRNRPELSWRPLYRVKKKIVRRTRVSSFVYISHGFESDAVIVGKQDSNPAQEATDPNLRFSPRCNAASKRSESDEHFLAKTNPY